MVWCPAAAGPSQSQIAADTEAEHQQPAEERRNAWIVPVLIATAPRPRSSSPMRQRRTARRTSALASATAWARASLARPTAPLRSRASADPGETPKIIHEFVAVGDAKRCRERVPQHQPSVRGRGVRLSWTDGRVDQTRRTLRSWPAGPVQPMARSCCSRASQRRCASFEPLT